jgi:hypothetical protein
MTIPKIISVDDHIVEPPDLWQRWLPARYRAQGPRVVAGPYEMVPDSLNPRAFRSGWTAFRVALDGPKTDWWVYEDFRTGTLIGNASAGLSADQVVPGPIRYADMRAGCYDRVARLADMDVNGVERSLCFPTFPRFCGQTFLEGHDRELGLVCVRAYNDFMVEEWAGDSGGRLIPLCLIPLWDAGLAAAEVRRNADRGVRAVAFSELPAASACPASTTPTGTGTLSSALATRPAPSSTCTSARPHRCPSRRKTLRRTCRSHSPPSTPSCRCPTGCCLACWPASAT